MTAGTHILGGVLLASIFHLPILPAAFGSVLPDVDWKKGLPKPWTRTLFNTHRGITHHIVIPLILVLISIYFRNDYSYEIGRYMLSFSIGYASHILLDILNPLGVPFTLKYYPRLSLKLVRSGKVGEIFVILILIVLLIYFVKSGELTYSSFIDKKSFKILNCLLQEVRG